jgi:hypothetical protein
VAWAMAAVADGATSTTLVARGREALGLVDDGDATGAGADGAVAPQPARTSATRPPIAP